MLSNQKFLSFMNKKKDGRKWIAVVYYKIDIQPGIGFECCGVRLKERAKYDFSETLPPSHSGQKMEEKMANFFRKSWLYQHLLAILYFGSCFGWGHEMLQCYTSLA